jgi:hypothetical protein
LSENWTNGMCTQWRGSTWAERTTGYLHHARVCPLGQKIGPRLYVGSIPRTIDHQQTGPCNPLKVGLIVFTLRDKGSRWNPGLKPPVEAYPNKNSTAAAARVAYPILIRHHDG